jgi:hypothetical protein
MSKPWTATILLVLVLCTAGATLAWAGPVVAPQGCETPALSSPAPAPGPLEPAAPVFAATCSSIYQACLAGCGGNITCRNKCYCNYLDCIGSDAPCPS